MMLERYLQQRREGSLDRVVRFNIARAVIICNRLDAIEWIIQLGDSNLLRMVCCHAAYCGRIDILSKVFLKLNVKMLDQLLNDDDGLLYYNAASYGQLQTLKWLRKYGAKWDAETFIGARDGGYKEIIQYLRDEGCPEDDDEDGDF